MTDDHALWTEKYRPKTFAEVFGQTDIVAKVKAFVAARNLPHLLFVGPAGVGKTTLALVVARELYGEGWKENVLELNASDERGIDVVRTKIKDFARTRSLGDIPFKLIYLDECDALTKEAQQALRRTMENYTQTCRFVLSCNYASKIIDPIQSRCAVFKFKPLTEAEVATIVDRMAREERITVDAAARHALLQVSEGDVRRLQNVLQACASISPTVTKDAVYQMASVAEPKEVLDVLKLAAAGQFLAAREKLLQTMLDYGMSGGDVIKQVAKEIWSLDIPEQRKLGFIIACGECEFRIVEGADEFIQLESLLATLAASGAKHI
jgi:replication factor C small subunit